MRYLASTHGTRRATMKLMRMRVLERKREYCGGRARDQVLEESLVDLIIVLGLECVCVCVCLWVGGEVGEI
jgi:hypothetical protein